MWPCDQIEIDKCQGGMLTVACGLWSQQGMKQWERKVRSASSLDELLRLADFPDWKLWRCRLRLQQPESLSSPPSGGSHRSTRYAAESYSLEILKGRIEWVDQVCVCVGGWGYSHMYVSLVAIDEEWQRTQCMPRETCVDVAKELSTDPSMFFKPPCVSVHRFVAQLTGDISKWCLRYYKTQWSCSSESAAAAVCFL